MSCKSDTKELIREFYASNETPDTAPSCAPYHNLWDMFREI